jgi:hypothetical protein
MASLVLRSNASLAELWFTAQDGAGATPAAMAAATRCSAVNELARTLCMVRQWQHGQLARPAPSVAVQQQQQQQQEEEEYSDDERTRAAVPPAALHVYERQPPQQQQPERTHAGDGTAARAPLAPAMRARAFISPFGTPAAAASVVPDAAAPTNASPHGGTAAAGASSDGSSGSVGGKAGSCSSSSSTSSTRTSNADSGSRHLRCDSGSCGASEPGTSPTAAGSSMQQRRAALSCRAVLPQQQLLSDARSSAHHSALCAVAEQAPVAATPRQHPEQPQEPQQVAACACAVIVAGLMTGLRNQLLASPGSSGVAAALLRGAQPLCWVLLLCCLLAGATPWPAAWALLCAAVSAALLQRLLGLLAQPALHGSLTDAAQLQACASLLWRRITQPLPRQHSRWTLAFADAQLEEQFLQVRVCLGA